MEVLVATAIIGMIAGVAMIGLSDARRAARTTTDLAAIRGHIQGFAAYQSAWDGQFPCYTRRDADITVVRTARAAEPLLILGYFGGSNMWPFALAAAIFDAEPDPRAFLSAHNPSDVEFTDFYYDQSFIADPRYWRRETRQGKAQWRSTRAHEVRHPDAKSIFVNTFRDSAFVTDGPLASRWDIGFTDGSARSIANGSVRTGYPGGACCEPCGLDSAEIGCLFYRPPGTCTIDGVRGRDIR